MTAAATAMEAVEAIQATFPALPEADYKLSERTGVLDNVEVLRTFDVFTADQMHAYASAYALASLAASQAKIGRLRVTLAGAVEVAKDAHAHWDADRDSKVGKILLALAGLNAKYDTRTDAIHAALTQGAQS